MSEKPLLTIDVVSDPVCPWCYVGKRSLDRALMALSFSYELDVRFRPFQLAPDLPPEGVDRAAYYAKKFPDVDKREQARTALEAAARQVGLALDSRLPQWQPNVLDALRLIRWSHEEGCQSSVVEAIFNAFWMRGLDIGAPEVLADIGAEEGMDRASLLARLSTQEDAGALKEEIADFRAGGVSGVPTFIVNEQTGFAGAHPPDVLLDAFRKLATETA